jgi:anti-sigma regulatory factor (Ser/Thr protein kinase)
MNTAIADPSQVSEGRRLAVEFARKTGLDDAKLARIALVATEMATNLVKHGGGGTLVVDRFDDADGRGIELMALDRGAGMADVRSCLADGYSTAGSPGTGFGAITRQSDRLVVFSRPGLGTAVMARLIFEPAGKLPSRTELGAISASYPGETVCGDHWAFAAGQTGRTLLVADGSGHGPEAARAALIAVQIFNDHRDDECVPLVDRLHRGLASTRGAALAVARIDTTASLVRFVGIGNIAGTLVSDGGVRRMVSHNGTAGHVAPRIREFTYPFTGKPLVILHSDGLSTKWGLADYPGLAASHPSLIAGVLFRDHRRGRDDATVVAVRPL